MIYNGDNISYLNVIIKKIVSLVKSCYNIESDGIINDLSIGFPLPPDAHLVECQDNQGINSTESTIVVEDNVEETYSMMKGAEGGKKVDVLADDISDKIGSVLGVSSGKELHQILDKANCFEGSTALQRMVEEQGKLEEATGSYFKTVEGIEVDEKPGVFGRRLKEGLKLERDGEGGIIDGVVGRVLPSE